MKTKLFLLVLCVVSSLAKANNIAVTNASLSNQSIANKTLNINFNVAWENSWRTSTNESNYDGAWVFVKYKLNGTSVWRHCTLKTTGFTAATGATVNIPSDSRGAFVYRSANGIGNISFSNNMLMWDYGADGVADNSTVEIKVFAVEMVYIPVGPYWLGSAAGGTEINAFKAGNTNNPYKVNGAGEIAINNTTGLSFNGSGTGTSIPASFPNGYNAFWVMKYETTQQQYADFLNTLTLAQAQALNLQPNLFTQAHPQLEAISADRAYSAGNQSNVSQYTAFADWSGLRPMSEMEYEKACRGVNINPVADEYVWGTTSLTNLTSVSNANGSDESVNVPSTANALVTTSLGRPARVGIFARATNSSRELSGATYYGVMNMSDNLYEWSVYSGSDAGRLITSTQHGTGSLTSNGTTNITSWQNTLAFGRRGGQYNTAVNSSAHNISRAKMADRYHAGSAHSTSSFNAIRLVRTAP